MMNGLIHAVEKKIDDPILPTPVLRSTDSQIDLDSEVDYLIQNNWAPDEERSEEFENLQFDSTHEEYIRNTDNCSYYSHPQRSLAIVRTMGDCDSLHGYELSQYMYLLVYALRLEPTSRNSVAMKKFCQSVKTKSHQADAFIRYATYRGYTVKFDESTGFSYTL